tara:strand:- start:2822 stop:3019 length:198 start_codon:yes stop_codon:yes gene_type:complete
MNLNKEQIQYVINLLQVDAQQVLNFKLDRLQENADTTQQDEFLKFNKAINDEFDYLLNDIKRNGF